MQVELFFEPDELELIQLALSECAGQLRNFAYARFMRLERPNLLVRADKMERLATSIRFSGQARDPETDSAPVVQVTDPVMKKES